MREGACSYELAGTITCTLDVLFKSIAILTDRSEQWPVQSFRVNALHDEPGPLSIITV